MNEDYFEYNNKNERAEKGDLIISEPFLPDNNFSRSVVLLCEHNADGAFGFVLNQPSNLKLGEILEEFEGADNDVYVGGPVQQDTLHFIHRVPDLLENSFEIKKGLYWGGNFEQLKILLKNDQITNDEIKFFVGYSGWSAGQLDDEQKINSWIVYKKTDIEQIFNTKPEMLWKQTLQTMGGKYRMFSNYPVDPRLN